MKTFLQRIDPRLFVLTNNALLLFLGKAFTGLQRDWSQIGLAFGAGLATELVCARTLFKHRRAPLWDRALSAAVVCVSTMILIRSIVWWFYGVIAIVAILSKYVLVDERGRHPFNPTNFAIVFALAFLPDLVFVRPDDFSSLYTFRLMIPVFGLLAILRGAVWRTTAGYFGTVLAVGLPVGMALGLKPLWILAPEVNTSTLIFAFLMITDPKSTPRTGWAQLGFGCLVALIHLTMRWIQVPFSPFVALFAVTALYSVGRSTQAVRAGTSSGADLVVPSSRST